MERMEVVAQVAEAWVGEGRAEVAQVGAKAEQGHTQPHRQKAHHRQGRVAHRHAQGRSPPQHTQSALHHTPHAHRITDTVSQWLPHQSPSSPHMDLLILSQSTWICSFIPQGIEGSTWRLVP